MIGQMSCKRNGGASSRTGILCVAVLCAAILSTLCAGAPAMAADLAGIAVQTQDEKTQVVLDFKNSDETLTASQFFMADPGRIVMDFKGTTLRAGPAEGASVLVSGVRASQFSPNASRVVVDLAQTAAIESAAWTADGQLVITLAQTGEKAFAAAVRAGRKPIARQEAQAAIHAPDTAKPVEVAGLAGPDVKPAASAEPADTKSADLKQTDAKPAATRPDDAKPQKAKVALAMPQPRVSRIAGRKPVVVIDAGHGGADPGAPSVLEGKTEKTVTLEIAKAIKAELERSGQIKAVLTRDKDVFIPLQERVAVARKLKADLFISVHADSIANPDIRGATVYTLSEKASDRESERLAAKENRADMIAGISFDTRTPDVADILLSLMQRETMNYSAEFAATAVDTMEDDIFFRTNHHRFAGFIVLKAPDIPSVLLETGYMSNLEDSKFLFSPDGQKKIARGVRAAVERYFARRTGKATASVR